jgi:Tol biopolymer transport system component
VAIAALDESKRSNRPTAQLPFGTIAFSSLAARGWDLYTTEIETHRTRRLTEHPVLDYNATFSSDGRRIAFASERDGNLDIYTMNADGTGVHPFPGFFLCYPSSDSSLPRSLL